ncbi:unnamed protein product [Caenorhabditis angaria]|uniref:SXP/RAL-2 family protein Ani s 5-like cation-binding domain-containing protein n=1 Tax=Caenorhabditis angaria TaxID=860376 RepID=A0A9P1II76_9PELO|nr:unnamed protein product [Caenorhabditis angaria]
MFKTLFFAVPLITVLLSATPITVTLGYEDRLETLVSQVYPEITTWLSKDQIGSLFEELLDVLKTAHTLEEIARQMTKPIISTLTPAQREQAWKSIQKAQDGFGGLKQFKIIFFHALDAVQEFMGDSMEKDRVEIRAEARAQNMTAVQVRSTILRTMQTYFNVEFGQKVMDTVKYSMTEEDWKVATEDAADYLTITNFDLTY